MVTPRDHPRSRGVYATLLAALTAMGGSSPLARGLPELLKPRARTLGIIPARAGFTGTLRVKCNDGSDHPRSRGVYEPRTVRSPVPDGSSPLARGLLKMNRPAENNSRIIPARAGFTIAVASNAKGERDHPRSRGVYPGAKRSQIAYVGSSPLARGLRQHHVRCPVLGGIIPARAGFTASSRNCLYCLRDHPRSRGVYRTSVALRVLSCGSSPLARGLRVAIILPFVQSGIIPARAGFTRIR